MKRAIIYGLLFIAWVNLAYAVDVRVGTTFSKQQSYYLELDWKEAYRAILDLDWDIIRLGAYWDEIEPLEGQYDFFDLDWQIKQAKTKKIPIILTVGIKAPRWPEYFIPAWVYEKADLGRSGDISKDPVLKEYAFEFIKNVINHYKDEAGIKYIQVENEALNRYGGRNWQLSREFLSEEVKLVSSLDPLRRPIILTTATQPNKFMRFLVNIFTKGNPIEDNLSMCDILGINVYPIIGRETLGIRHYLKNPKKQREERFSYIRTLAKEEGKEVWITELQAEPWEPGDLVHKKKENPPSASPEMTREYFQDLKEQGFKTILFWGAEYWYYQKARNNNNSWWRMAEEIIRSN